MLNDEIKGYTLEEAQELADLFDTTITPVFGGYQLEVGFPGGFSPSGPLPLDLIVYDLQASKECLERQGISLPLDYDQ